MQLFEKALAFDADLTQRLSIARRPGLLRTIAAFLAHSGDSWFWLVGLSLIWWMGSLDWKERAMKLGVGILVTAVTVLAVKFSIRRRRPEGDWGAIYRQTDPHSFPSGHAARAVMLAVLAVGLGPVWLGWLLAIWAPCVALARVLMGVHYLSDVLAGMLFGAVMGVGLLAALPLIF